MKAYILRIELLDSNPTIWRRVIMPAGATFNRLNDVIQNVSNFESGYPYEARHLFQFNLDNLLVTNNEEAYREHQHYKKNKSFFAERLKNTPIEFLEFEKAYQERLKLEIRIPTSIKIDQYIERQKEIIYDYDFGDDWHFSIKLEEIVHDYYFGYPTLLDGAETAPPEDVGGIDGYYDFLEVYNNNQNPNHQNVLDWLENSNFRTYDPRVINSFFKSIAYKKTEWDKIEHDNYKIIQNKYRVE